MCISIYIYTHFFYQSNPPHLSYLLGYNGIKLDNNMMGFSVISWDKWVVPLNHPLNNRIFHEVHKHK